MTASLEVSGAERFVTRTHLGRLFVFVSRPPARRGDGKLSWAQWTIAVGAGLILTSIKGAFHSVGPRSGTTLLRSVTSVLYAAASMAQA